MAGLRPSGLPQSGLVQRRFSLMPGSIRLREFIPSQGSTMPLLKIGLSEKFNFTARATA
jgi:hypothetical protein